MTDRLQTAFAHPDQSPGLLLWQVTNKWQAVQRAALAPLGLTHVQFVLLASLTWIASNGSVVTQRALADHAGSDPMMTSQVLGTLEQKGLVQRASHPTDGRAKSLAPTAAGVELANRAIVIVERCDSEFFGPLCGSSGFLTTLVTLRDR